MIYDKAGGGSSINCDGVQNSVFRNNLVTTPTPAASPLPDRRRRGIHGQYGGEQHIWSRPTAAALNIRTEALAARSATTSCTTSRPGQHRHLGGQPNRAGQRLQRGDGPVHAGRRSTTQTSPCGGRPPARTPIRSWRPRPPCSSTVGQRLSPEGRRPGDRPRDLVERPGGGLRGDRPAKAAGYDIGHDEYVLNVPPRLRLRPHHLRRRLSTAAAGGHPSVQYGRVFGLGGRWASHSYRARSAGRPAGASVRPAAARPPRGRTTAASGTLTWAAGDTATRHSPL